jgi:hypothetical protein
VGKDYFLISNEVADLIFGHKWLRLLGGCEVARAKLRAEVSELREARWEPMFRFLIMLNKVVWLLLVFKGGLDVPAN